MQTPEGLSDVSMRVWEEVVSSHERMSLARLKLLEEGLFALDRAQRARDIIQKEGLLVEGEKSKIPHAHPCLRVEKEAKAQFLKVWKLLGLRWNQLIDKRKKGPGELPTIEEILGELEGN